jgi:hypothetical protein
VSTNSAWRKEKPKERGIKIKKGTRCMQRTCSCRNENMGATALGGACSNATAFERLIDCEITDDGLRRAALQSSSARLNKTRREESLSSNAARRGSAFKSDESTDATRVTANSDSVCSARSAVPFAFMLAEEEKIDVSRSLLGFGQTR